MGETDGARAVACDPTDRLHALAERQHGVVARYQLIGEGWSSSAISGLSNYHGWEPVTSRVLRRQGSPDTSAQRVSTVVLDAGPGAYLSHGSAAAWWGHRGSRLERPVHVVTTRYRKRTHRLARIHRVREVDVRWVTDLDGVFVVRPELLALQLFATHRYERAERIVESLWSRRLLSGASIRAVLADVGVQGRNGTAGLRRYVDQRGPDYMPPGSGLEARTRTILNRAGIRLEPQVDVGGETHWTGRVDFLVVGLRVVIEVQSELHHSSMVDREADRLRIGKLEADGFVVVEVTEEMVWTDPGRLLEVVREGLGRAHRGRSVGPTSTC